VIDSYKKRREVIKKCYNKSGHQGRESTYLRVAIRYFWGGYFIDYKAYVKSCPGCQIRATNRQKEAIHPSTANNLI
jgi:hypothetical protein